MLRRTIPTALSWLLFLTFAAATEGSFRGTVVDPPTNQAADGWLYVKGHNGMLRRVDISHAHVTANNHARANQLPAGTEVRVTAEQGSDGEWHATQVEIIENEKK